MAKIILIDDDEYLRALLAKSLERAGHSVLQAGNGREGMALFHSDPCDIVVTDIVMPEQEGIETILELKKARPGLAIVAISAYWQGAEDYLQFARQLGVDYALRKPLAPEALLACIDEILSRREISSASNS